MSGPSAVLAAPSAPSLAAMGMPMEHVRAQAVVKAVDGTMAQVRETILAQTAALVGEYVALQAETGKADESVASAFDEAMAAFQAEIGEHMGRILASTGECVRKAGEAVMPAVRETASASDPSMDTGSNSEADEEDGSAASAELPAVALKHGRVFNFSAGPGTLDINVMERAHAEFFNYRETGMSVMELSHRDPEGPIHTMMMKAVANVRSLLKVPDNYEVLFMHGGAHGQFAAAPMNLLGKRRKVAYVNTGFWAVRAMSEAERYAETSMVADAAPYGYTTIPDAATWKIDEDAAYVHMCANETINGMEILEDPVLPEGCGVPLVGDFTSTLLSRPVDVSKYGMIFASSGKNLGPAGVCLVIVRKDLLDREALPETPSILNLRKAAETEPIPSIYNTPPTWNIYFLGLILDDLVARGGLEAAAQRNRCKAARVYEVIDNSNGFYMNHVDAKYRSVMNIAFGINNGKGEPHRALQDVFVQEADKNGMVQLFGHKSAGGLRITMYNGLPVEAVDRLIVFLIAFQDKYASSVVASA